MPVERIRTYTRRSLEADSTPAYNVQNIRRWVKVDAPNWSVVFVRGPGFIHIRMRPNISRPRAIAHAEFDCRMVNKTLAS